MDHVVTHDSHRSFDSKSEWYECDDGLPEIDWDAWGEPGKVFLRSGRNSVYQRYIVITYGDGRTVIADGPEFHYWDEPLWDSELRRPTATGVGESSNG